MNDCRINRVTLTGFMSAKGDRDICVKVFDRTATIVLCNIDSKLNDDAKKYGAYDVLDWWLLRDKTVAVSIAISKKL